MPTRPSPTLAEHFGDLEDPRVERTRRHNLLDIIVIAVCAVICHADTWVDIEEFGKAKEAWLKTFLELPGGIPSHDTFGRVFSRLDPEQFQASFRRWVQAAVEQAAGSLVAIDGKSARGSHDRAGGKDMLHMISAWATDAELVLAQRKVGEGTNELGELPELLRLLELSGCIVTIDAIACQKDIAQTLRAQGAHYVLAVKDNQPKLHERISRVFSSLDTPGTPRPTFDHHRTVDKGHGRVEIRDYWTISDPEYLAWIDPQGDWSDLSTVIKVVAERRVGDQTSIATRHYISSLSADAKTAARVVRGHWSIENQLHWVLDVAFREDDSRVRTGNAQENLVVLRHIALNLVKQEKTSKRSVNGKRLKAGWDNDYLLAVLNTTLG